MGQYMTVSIYAVATVFIVVVSFSGGRTTAVQAIALQRKDLEERVQVARSFHETNATYRSY